LSAKKKRKTSQNSTTIKEKRINSQYKLDKQKTVKIRDNVDTIDTDTEDNNGDDQRNYEENSLRNSMAIKEKRISSQYNFNKQKTIEIS
ncbi:7648_t:CDS:2, partial [Scutellospora calospora]